MARIKLYSVNLDLLKKTKEKGFCLCEVKKNEDNSNVCPCNDFLKKGNCKCGVYRRSAAL